jgi:5-methyltetrahydrofolate--homocysteine methyltransferase
VIIIGEKINSSRKQISQAVLSNDASLIQKEAQDQVSAGVDYIDVNAGSFLGEEAVRLQWLIDVIQEVTSVPLCIDTPDPGVIKHVLPLVRHKPMINSITLEPARLQGMLPLAVEYEAKVIALCQTENTIAEKTGAKVKMAEQLVEKLTAVGIPIDHIYVDPLVYPLSADHNSALSTLHAIRQIMSAFPGVHTTCGLTNVSHGLPNRKLINRSFLVAAIVSGLDSALLDPTDKLLYGSLMAALTVVGKDEFCLDYITAFRKGHF